MFVNLFSFLLYIESNLSPFHNTRWLVPYVFGNSDDLEFWQRHPTSLDSILRKVRRPYDDVCEIHAQIKKQVQYLYTTTFLSLHGYDIKTLMVELSKSSMVLHTKIVGYESRDCFSYYWRLLITFTLLGFARDREYCTVQYMHSMAAEETKRWTKPNISASEDMEHAFGRDEAQTL